jgi:phage terminase large subunit GpA-like protein
MLARGVWMAEDRLRKTAGFWINEFYSPWKHWEDIIVDFLRCKNNPTRLQVFVNTSLGEVWRQRGEAPSWRRLYERRETYKPGELQPGVAFITAGADVQKDRICVEFVGWGKGLQSWSLDYVVINGDTSKDAIWGDLDKQVARTFSFNGSSEIPVRSFAIDSGAFTQTVYNWVRKWPRNKVYAIKGRDELNVLVDTPKKIEVRQSGKKRRRGLQLWMVGVSVAKTELYGFLRQNAPEPGEDFPYGYCHFPEYGPEYFKELTAEQLVSRDVRGFKKFFWEKVPHRNNEALDCRVYARAAAYLAGLDRMKDRDFDRILLSGGNAPIEPSSFNVVGPAPQKAHVKPVAAKVVKKPVKKKKVVRRRSGGGFWR